MKVYVAGRTTDLERVRRVQDLLNFGGHSLTYDWTYNVELTKQDGGMPPAEAAEFDLQGVKNADLVIALWAPGWLGTAIEIGYALALNIPVQIVYSEDMPMDRPCVFFDLPTVTAQNVTDVFDDFTI